ncbi:hypothetical protein [uncultured Roseovarius sp.]|uniref:hypothetical protein n=1 Tax=uncultured Roseovarius sp. TaxID=293344 RepID=UPI0025972B61|nr:hypothetical protein [uncultured Roseovarius sp.]
MDSLWLFDLLERFQATLVGVVGFVGVVWTLRNNARLSREEHQRQTEGRQTALRRILAAEFQNYSDALKLNLRATKPSDGMISIGKVRKVFSEDLVADLGLLEPSEIDAVVNALISLDGMAHYLDNLSVERSDTRFLIPAKSLDHVRLVSSTTSAALDSAVKAIALSCKA